MLVNHALLSTNAFLLVDAVTRRFGTRLITELNGLYFSVPHIYYLTLSTLLLYLGFPGSLSFLIEILFFSFLFDLEPMGAIISLILIYLVMPLLFFRP